LPLLAAESPEPRGHVDPGRGGLSGAGLPVFHQHFSPLAAAIVELVETFDGDASLRTRVGQGDVADVFSFVPTRRPAQTCLMANIASGVG
jgi:hypothetical protein